MVSLGEGGSGKFRRGAFVVLVSLVKGGESGLVKKREVRAKFWRGGSGVSLGEGVWGKFRKEGLG